MRAVLCEQNAAVMRTAAHRAVAGHQAGRGSVTRHINKYKHKQIQIAVFSLFLIKSTFQWRFNIDEVYG